MCVPTAHDSPPGTLQRVFRLSCIQLIRHVGVNEIHDVRLLVVREDPCKLSHSSCDRILEGTIKRALEGELVHNGLTKLTEARCSHECGSLPQLESIDIPRETLGDA